MDRNDSESPVLAIDPGRDKLGIAVLARSGDVLIREVILRDKFADSYSDMVKMYAPGLIVTGDGTGSDWIMAVLEAHGEIRVVRINEGGSTLEARELAWRENPPGGISGSFRSCSGPYRKVLTAGRRL